MDSLTIEELPPDSAPRCGAESITTASSTSETRPILKQFDYALVRWVTRKYKRSGDSPTRTRAWLKRVVAQQPHLFAHWHITYAGTAER